MLSKLVSASDVAQQIEHWIDTVADCLRRRQLAAAENVCRKALKWAKLFEEKRMEGLSYIAYVHVLNEKREYASAVKAGAQAQRLLEPFDDLAVKKACCQLHGHLCISHNYLGNTEQEKNHQKKGVELAKSLGIANEIISMFTHFACNVDTSINPKEHLRKFINYCKRGYEHSLAKDEHCFEKNEGNKREKWINYSMFVTLGRNILTLWYEDKHALQEGELQLALRVLEDEYKNQYLSKFYLETGSAKLAQEMECDVAEFLYWTYLALGEMDKANKLKQIEGLYSSSLPRFPG